MTDPLPSSGDSAGTASNTPVSWEATERAAAALRRVNRALSGRYASDELLDEIAAGADAAATRLEAGIERVKIDDMLSRPHLREIYEGQYFPLPLEPGDEIEFDPFSIGGGQLHPASIDVTFIKDSDEAVSGHAIIDPMFAGPPERTHGGIAALIIDELMGALNRMRGRQAFTARLTVNYRAATPLGETLQLRAWIHDTTRRKITVRAEVHASDGLCVDAEGLFIMRADQDPHPDINPA